MYEHKKPKQCHLDTSYKVLGPPLGYWPEILSKCHLYTLSSESYPNFSLCRLSTSKKVLSPTTSSSTLPGCVRMSLGRPWLQGTSPRPLSLASAHTGSRRRQFSGSSRSTWNATTSASSSSSCRTSTSVIMTRRMMSSVSPPSSPRV